MTAVRVRWTFSATVKRPAERLLCSLCASEGHSRRAVVAVKYRFGSEFLCRRCALAGSSPMGRAIARGVRQMDEQRRRARRTEDA